jgi:hypothetical protein
MLFFYVSFLNAVYLLLISFLVTLHYTVVIQVVLNWALFCSLTHECGIFILISKIVTVVDRCVTIFVDRIQMYNERDILYA